jgi:membrane-bound ClpP family serine protease
MDALVGFNVGFWDYVTFVSLAVIGAAFIGVLVFILGLPGRIAIARNHPEAEAVYVMGWLGFLAVVPWIQAFMWAFKPTNIIDIRNLPKEEKRATDAMIARLKGEATTPDAGRSPNKGPPL